MKLFYLINSLGAGGAERSLAELLPFFVDEGIETTVVCLRRCEVGVEANVRLLGCNLVFLPGNGRLQWISGFRRLLLTGRPDLVHTTLFDSHIVGRIAAAGTGTPVLSSLVNTAYSAVRLQDRDLNPVGFRLVRALDRWTSRNLTTHFHAITHAVRDAYVESLGISPDDVTVIERGRDVHRLGTPGEERRRRVRESLGLSMDQEVLINLGRQEYQKGQPFLLQSMAELVKRRPRLVLLIAGRDGNLTPELSRLHRELGLGDHVRFLGHRSDAPDLLAASDLFVFPSLFEGLGGALIEAMALGLPAVVSDIPALREVVEVGRTGDLVPPSSPGALARAIDDLLSSPERMEEYGANARARFHERFEIRHSAERMIRLYHRLVRGRVPAAVAA
jgi:glycosyltransferase involved in cell wall biosynthesis